MNKAHSQKERWFIFCRHWPCDTRRNKQSRSRLGIFAWTCVEVTSISAKSVRVGHILVHLYRNYQSLIEGLSRLREHGWVGNKLESAVASSEKLLSDDIGHPWFTMCHPTLFIVWLEVWREDNIENTALRSSFLDAHTWECGHCLWCICGLHLKMFRGQLKGFFLSQFSLVVTYWKRFSDNENRIEDDTQLGSTFEGPGDGSKRLDPWL